MGHRNKDNSALLATKRLLLSVKNKLFACEEELNNKDKYIEALEGALDSYKKRVRAKERGG